MHKRSTADQTSSVKDQIRYHGVCEKKGMQSSTTEMQSAARKDGWGRKKEQENG